MASEEVIKTLKENLCSLCTYGSQNMESCDIRSCDNRDAIKAIERSLCDSCKEMSMITELIERLKDLYVDPELDMLCTFDGECRQAIKEAADTIEELSAKLQAANMERSSQYYNGGWIPISEGLPKRNGYYLVTGRQGAVNKRLYQDGHWYENWGDFSMDAITRTI